MNDRKKELKFFRKYGFCPYVCECKDSNGCEGTGADFKLCRGLDDLSIEQKKKDETKVKVQFT